MKSRSPGHTKDDECPHPHPYPLPEGEGIIPSPSRGGTGWGWVNQDFQVKQALTIAEILRWAEGYLIQQEVPSPYVDAEYILAHILRCQRKDLLIHPYRALLADEVAKFSACVERRGRREPLQYITGEVEFRGLLFH